MLGDQLSAGVNYALALAHAQGAHLSALIEEFDTYPSNSPLEPNNMPADGTNEPPSLADRLARTSDLIHSAAKLANVPCEILRRDDFYSLRQGLMYLAQVRDV